jgi:hypothetical protein
MRPMRPSRNFVYAFALATILLSQQIVSQTQPSSQPNANSAVGRKVTVSLSLRPVSEAPFQFACDVIEEESMYSWLS